MIRYHHPPFVKHVLALQNEFGTQKIRGQFTKVLGIGKTSPPIWEKFPNNPVIFFRERPSSPTSSTIQRIALTSSFFSPAIHTTLLGFGNMKVLKLNLEVYFVLQKFWGGNLISLQKFCLVIELSQVVQNGLTETEEKVYRLFELDYHKSG